MNPYVQGLLMSLGGAMQQPFMGGNPIGIGHAGGLQAQEEHRIRMYQQQEEERLLREEAMRRRQLELQERSAGLSERQFEARQEQFRQAAASEEAERLAQQLLTAQTREQQEAALRELYGTQGAAIGNLPSNLQPTALSGVLRQRQGAAGSAPKSARWRIEGDEGQVFAWDPYNPDVLHEAPVRESLVTPEEERRRIMAQIDAVREAADAFIPGEDRATRDQRQNEAAQEVARLTEMLQTRIRPTATVADATEALRDKMTPDEIADWSRRYFLALAQDPALAQDMIDRAVGQ